MALPGHASIIAPKPAESIASNMVMSRLEHLRMADPSSKSCRRDRYHLLVGDFIAFIERSTFPGQ